MLPQKKIRVLVVDDSLLCRKRVSMALSSDPSIEIVGTASDPFEARDLILAKRPDVITCDIEMPKMNGIEFVRQLIPQYFVPVVMVSSVSGAVFDALRAGAVDFVVKENATLTGDLDSFNKDLIHKVKAASKAKKPIDVIRIRPSNMQALPTSPLSNSKNVIAIGASTGGTEAIYSLLKNLEPSIPGIVIVQHIPPVFSNMFAARLNEQTELSVKEAETGDYLERGKVIVAPGDRHMRIKRIGDRYKVECFEGEKVNGHCPSVDILFDSVAKEARENSIGILLTGMGYDGAKGLLSMKRKGARTIGQDQKSSVVYGMPKVAYDIGAVEIQSDIANMPGVLSKMLSKMDERR